MNEPDLVYLVNDGSSSASLNRGFGVESLFKIPEDSKCQSESQVGGIEAKSEKGRSYRIKKKKPKELEVRMEDRVAEQVKRQGQTRDKRGKQMFG